MTKIGKNSKATTQKHALSNEKNTKGDVHVQMNDAIKDMDRKEMYLDDLIPSFVYKIKAKEIEDKIIKNGTANCTRMNELKSIIKTSSNVTLKRKGSVTFHGDTIFSEQVESLPVRGDQISSNEEDANNKVTDHITIRRTLSSVGRFTLLSEVPTNLSIISCILLLEQPGLTHQQLITFLRERLTKKFYRFRSKVIDYSLFEEVENLDINEQIRYAELDKIDKNLHKYDNNGTDEEYEEHLLREKLSSFINVPLDLNKPLWEVIIIPNYSRGYVMFIRAHHCLGDGTSLAMVFNQLCDQPAILKTPGTGGKAILKNTTRDTMTWRWGNVIRFWRIVSMMWFFFMFTVGCILLVLKWTRELVRGKDPKTLFKGEVGLKKRVAFSTSKITVEKVRLAARPYHATVNDVMLTCLAGALDRYTYRYEQQHNISDTRPRNTCIRVGIPVNVRPPTEMDIKPSNKFGFVIASLPIRMRNDLIGQLRKIKSNMDFNKRLPEQYASFKTSQYVDMLPTPVIKATFDYLADYLTGVLTNVRGAERKSHICCLAVKDIIAFVPPPSGVGLGVAIFSYRGKISVSLVTDDNLIKDPEMLVQDFEDTFEQLLQIATADSVTDYVLNKQE